MSGASWGGDVFDRLYAGNPDPWGFTTSPYEAEKYRDTLALLDAARPSRRFARAVELGCSIGVFTAMLAPRCDALLGIDVAAAAVERARTRCASLPQVRLECGALPAAWPEGRFDLVVVSELLYFLAADDLARLAAAVVAGTTADATILLVNWTGETDTPLTGDAAAEGFVAACGPTFGVRHAARRERYRIELLTRSG